jgi:hypothetical protein
VLNQQNSLATFLFDTTGAKRKVYKRKTPFWGFRALRSATGVSPPAHEKLLKKFYQNFHNGFVRFLIFDQNFHNGFVRFLMFDQNFHSELVRVLKSPLHAFSRSHRKLGENGFF